MFEALFEQIEEGLPGFRAIAVVGDDGMEVEARIKKELPHEVLSAEMNGIVRIIKRLREELDMGELSELILRTDRRNIILFDLKAGLFILLVTDFSETTGRTRFKVQSLASKFMDAIG